MISIRELHQKRPKLLEDFVRKLYAEEIKEGGKDIKFISSERGYLEYKLGDEYIDIDIDAVYIEGVENKDKSMQVMKFMAKIYGQEVIDEIMKTRKLILNDMVACYNKETERILLELHKTLEKPIENESEFRR